MFDKNNFINNLIDVLNNEKVEKFKKEKRKWYIEERIAKLQNELNKLDQ